MKGLHHVGITVKDLDASIRFYHDVLGLEFSNEPSPWFDGPELGPAVGVPGGALRQVSLLLGDTTLELLEYRSPASETERPLGSHSLGVFNVSLEIANMPGTELVAPINRAVLPAYVKLAAELPALAREYLSVMSVIALIAVPAVAGFAACAPFLVLLILGPQWMEAATVLQILAFFGITQVLQSNAYSAFLALNRHQVFIKINGFQTAILVPLMTLGAIRYGPVGAAWAYLATAAAVLPVSFLFITRFLQLNPLALLSNLWRPACAGAFMYFAVRTLGPSTPETALPASLAAKSLALCVTIGVPSYALSIVLLWLLAGSPKGSAESLLIGRIPAAVRKVRSLFAGAAVEDGGPR